MSGVVKGLFGGGRRDRGLEAIQQRQAEDANNRERELRAEQDAVTNVSGRRRRGRSLLRFSSDQGSNTFGGGS